MWLKHIQQEHRREWHCTMATHRPIVFSDREKFETHVATDHKGKVGQALLATLVRRGARPANHAFDECPLCKVQREVINGEDHIPVDIAISDRLPRHVAGHLKYFALRFLPPENNLHDDETCGTRTSLNPNSSQNLDSDLMSGIPLTFEDDASSAIDYDETEWLFLPRLAYEGQDHDVGLESFIVRFEARLKKVFPSGIKLLHNPEYSMVESVNSFQL
jgi:hypothetical protein